jgi:hypothetical protein
MAMSSTDLRSEAQNQGAKGTRKGEIMNKESVTSGGGGVVKLPPSCPSAVSLSTSYGYTYLTGSGLIVGLSGSGCSTSSHAVTITLPNVETDPSAVINPKVTVTPNCPPTAPTDCTFSFSFSSPDGFIGFLDVGPALALLYLTEADAAAATNSAGSQFTVQFVASQPATGAGYTLTFYLWNTDN